MLRCVSLRRTRVEPDLSDYPYGTALAMPFAMTNTPLPHLTGLQSIGSPSASPQARTAAPGSNTAPPTAADGSSSPPFSTVLAGLQTLGNATATSATSATLASTAVPPAAPGALLSNGIGGTVESNTSDADPSPSTSSKAVPKSVGTLKNAASRLRQAVPDALVAFGLPDPANAILFTPPIAPVIPKFVAGAPVAATNGLAPIGQRSAASAAGPAIPELTEPPLVEGQAGPAASPLLALSTALPKTLATTDAGTSPSLGTPSILGGPAVNVVQAAAPATAAKAAGPQPALQVAPALVQLTHTANGGQLTLQLNPNELGRVHIQIERAADGTANVQVTADRPETLQLLVADQAQLHHALDNAGLPQEGRTLSLNLAKPETNTGEGFNSGAGGGNNSATGERSNGQQGRPSSRGSDDETGPWAFGTTSATSSALTTSRLRAGVDITA